MSSNASWLCSEACFIHLANPDLIQTQTQNWTENFALFNLLNNKISKTFKSSFELLCFLVVFWKPIHSIGQYRPNPDQIEKLIKSCIRNFTASKPFSNFPWLWLEAYFMPSVNPDLKMNYKFCSLQFSEEQKYKNM